MNARDRGEKRKALAYLGLGSNLGDRVAHLRDGIAAIRDQPEIFRTRCSSVYASRPWDGDRSQPEFLNMVMEIQTSLAPEPLLDRCLQVEAAIGRSRGRRWGPRTLDVDLLLYDDVEIETERLTVPHPRLCDRGFVLIPIIELAPELILPDGESVRARLRRLPPQALRDVWPWRGRSPLEAGTRSAAEAVERDGNHGNG